MHGSSLTTPDMGVTEQAALLRSVLQSVTEHSIVATDLDGGILVWNTGARRLYGYEAEDVIGKSVFLLADAEDPASVHAQAILNRFHEMGQWSGKLRLVRKDGSVLVAMVTVTQRHDEDGSRAGFTMISQAIDEPRQGAEKRV
jgi:PAS domain S-box-containing protein